MWTRPDYGYFDAAKSCTLPFLLFSKVQCTLGLVHSNGTSAQDWPDSKFLVSAGKHDPSGLAGKAIAILWASAEQLDTRM